MHFRSHALLRKLLNRFIQPPLGILMQLSFVFSLVKYSGEAWQLREHGDNVNQQEGRLEAQSEIRGYTNCFLRVVAEINRANDPFGWQHDFSRFLLAKHPDLLS